MSAYIAITVVCIVFGLVTWKQQQTIDKLTNKVMAKDLREYKQITDPEPVKPPREEDKPKSWYDTN